MTTTSETTSIPPDEFIQTIREDALNTLLFAARFFAGGLILIGYLVFDLPGGKLALSCGILIFLACQFASWVNHRGQFFPAAALLLAVHTAAIGLTVTVYGLHSNPFVFFLPLLVGIAALLLRPAFGFMIALIALAVIIAIAISYGYGLEVLRLRFAAAITLSLLSAGVTLLSSQGLIAAIDWALESYRRVERREQQLFDSERRLHMSLGEREQLNIELTRSNQALDRARAAAEDASRLKSQFVRNMSHEVRTPLNAIIGLSYILTQGFKGPLTEEQTDYVRRIYDSGNHLLRLLNDILDNAKMEAGKLDLHIEPMLLDTLFADVLPTAQILLRDKPIRLYQEIAPDLPLVAADRLRIAQVLLNLISNAAKFTERGTITLRAYPVPHQPDNVAIEVTDTGIGIAPEHHNLIFEEFRQVDETTSRRYGGTGLGLPISRRLVQMHGGTLMVRSEVGRGSTFTFTLSAAAVPVEDLVAA